MGDRNDDEANARCMPIWVMKFDVRSQSPTRDRAPDHFALRSGTATQFLATTCGTSDTGLWTNRLTSHRVSSSRHPCESRAFAWVGCFGSLELCAMVFVLRDCSMVMSTTKVADHFAESIKLVFATRINGGHSRQFLEARLCSLTSRASRARRRQTTCSVQ